MKSFLLAALLGLLTGSAVSAQHRPAAAAPPPTDSLRLRLEQIFAPLDKSQVPTAYLAEFASPLLEPRFYNGVPSDSNRTDLTVFHYLRATMASARITGTDTLPTDAQLNARLDAAGHRFPGSLPLALHYQAYARVRPDALALNLLRVQNEQVYDVPGRTQSPYLTRTLFTAAPAHSSVAGPAVSFVFRRALYLSPDGTLPLSLELDFGDGRGYQSATWDQPVATTYSGAGTYRVRVRAVYYNPQVGFAGLASHFDLTVRAAPLAMRYDPSMGFDQSFPPDSRHSGGQVRVVYGAGHGNQEIRKPFIVAEGYNIAEIAPSLVKCDNENNDYQQFLDDINIPFFPNGNFNDALHAAGYDIVYIDNRKGTDDIRRNAALFEEVVRWVNQKKRAVGSTEQNVVIGQSMGGLVARYGLAEMVRNPLYVNGRNENDPETRLLILHDSPQRGANNPIGLQSLTRSTDVPFFLGRFSLGQMSDNLRDARRVLDAPATSQLSIYNAFNGRGDIRANTFIDGEYQQMINFSQYPSAYQPAYGIIAASDGSQCGRPQAIAPRTTLTQTYGEALLRPVPYLGNFTFRADMAAYSLPPQGQQAEISHAKVWCTFTLCFGAGPFRVCIPVANIYGLRESALSPPNALPLETLPGGTINPSTGADPCTKGIDWGIPGLFRVYLKRSSTMVTFASCPRTVPWTYPLPLRPTHMPGMPAD
jgi:pimeloyl-ACP methyl ester carboxylesterase